MIGLATRLVLGGDDGCCFLIIGGIVAFIALCGIYQCCACSLRDCSCMKKLLRTVGVDPYDDFDLTIIVHQAYFTSKTKHLSTRVRVTAGLQVVETEPNDDGIFQQPLELHVEQGTEKIDVELVDTHRSAVTARLSWEPIKDILNTLHEPETLYPLKQQSRETLNPRLKMSLFVATEGADMEQALLPNLQVGVETNLMLSQQIKKALASEEDDGVKRTKTRSQLSDLELMVKGTAGPLEIYETWGHTRTVWLAVRGPPDIRKYKLGIWERQEEQEQGQKPDTEVNLLRVLSVGPDPSRSDVFTLSFVDDQKYRQRMVFKRLDRNRDVWVEMIRALIEMLREDKAQKKDHRHRS